MAFEGGVFGAAAYLMGLINADSLAAHAVALQIAAITFMVPWGMAQAATVRVGLCLGRGDRDGIGRAGWTALVIGVGFMSVMALVIWVVPRELMTLFLDDTPANARVIALGVSFLGGRRHLPDRRRRAGGRRRGCCAASTTPACRCSSPSSAIG